MNGTAASRLLPKSHRHSRPVNSRANSSRSGHLVPNGDAQRSRGNHLDSMADEHTSLLARPLRNSEGQFLWEDSRPYVSYPSLFLLKTWQTLASNYVNVLLVFVPLGIVAGIAGWNPTAIFILNFFAIIPLASLLSFATEELSAKLGQTLGGLLNATFGNAVELIVSKSARHQLRDTDCARRLASWHFAIMKSASYSQACSARSCPTSCWCSGAVS